VAWGRSSRPAGPSGRGRSEGLRLLRGLSRRRALFLDVVGHLEAQVDSFTQSGHKMKDLIYAVYTSDDFVKF
jgi:hypothetical protein